jgi:precorrin-4/cobalt-precorrin-4 C11-methyltransferase
VTVYFIGAGPGDPELLTLRGRDLIARCPLVLYAGSLVPRAVIAHVGADAEVIDTAPLTLDEIMAHIERFAARGADVARVHSGDPSLYGAIAEQMRRLDAMGISYEVVPGVPAYAAAAALLKTELTLPEVSQTVILTRTPGKASPMPKGEELKSLGASGATLAIHLSVRNIHLVVADLTPVYGADCPAVVVYRVGWPDQQVIRGTLGDIKAKVKASRITRTALIFVGRVFANRDFSDSRLYHEDHRHILRPRRRGTA